MPFFPVLAPPPQVGDGKHASPIKPDAASDTKARRLADAESTVAIKQNGVLPVQGHPFAVDDVERHASSILGHREFAYHVAVFEVHWCRPRHGSAPDRTGYGIVSVPCRRLQVSLGTKEDGIAGQGDDLL